MAAKLSLAKEEVAQTYVRLKRDVNETFATPHGKNALRYLMKQCGYHSSDVPCDSKTGDLQLHGMLYNSARRNVYLGLRALLNDEILIDVEIRTPATETE